MGKKVLIIDDDEEMCEEMEEVLKDEGYCVSVAFEGLKGKKLVEEYDYDVLLLDLKLPGLSGLDILRNVKEKSSKIKVLILTGRPLTGKLLREQGSCEAKEKGMLRLADGVINKPFDVEMVLGKIRELTSHDSKIVNT